MAIFNMYAGRRDLSNGNWHRFIWNIFFSVFCNVYLDVYEYDANEMVTTIF